MTETSYVIHGMCLRLRLYTCTTCENACICVCVCVSWVYERRHEIFGKNLHTHMQTNKREHTAPAFRFEMIFLHQTIYTEKMYWQKPKFTRLKIHFNLHLLHRSEYFMQGVCASALVNKTKRSQRMKLMAFMSDDSSAVVNFLSLSLRTPSVSSAFFLLLHCDSAPLFARGAFLPYLLLLAHSQKYSHKQCVQCACAFVVVKRLSHIWLRTLDITMKLCGSRIVLHTLQAI